MLEAWSRTRDGTRKLSANFTVAEFACKDGSDPVFVDSSLAALLQKIRDHFGRPVVITSGYRTAADNRSVGGAAYSQHLYGRAADIRVQGIPVEQLAAYAETCLPGTGASWVPSLRRRYRAMAQSAQLSGSWNCSRSTPSAFCAPRCRRLGCGRNSVPPQAR